MNYNEAVEEVMKEIEKGNILVKNIWTSGGGQCIATIEVPFMIPEVKKHSLCEIYNELYDKVMRQTGGSIRLANIHAVENTVRIWREQYE